MEVPGGKNFKVSVLIAEALGTATLLYAINMSKGNPMAIGLTIAANIFIFGNICGGHFNPAVSVGVYVREITAKRADGEMFFYFILHVLAEIVGAFFGCFIVYLSNDSSFSRTAYLYPAKGLLFPAANFGQVFLTEMWVTFFFVSVILGIKY